MDWYRSCWREDLRLEVVEKKVDDLSGEEEMEISEQNTDWREERKV